LCAPEARGASKKRKGGGFFAKPYHPPHPVLAQHALSAQAAPCGILSFTALVYTEKRKGCMIVYDMVCVIADCDSVLERL
jgi:hypothetical protein